MRGNTRINRRRGSPIGILARLGLVLPFAALALNAPTALAQSYTIELLPPLPGFARSFALGMNDAGIVVGTSDTAGQWLATRWTSGTPESLGTLPGWSQAIALDINSDGTLIVGEARKGNDWIPFVWEQGAGLSELPAPPLVTVAGGWQVNDAGVIVGRSFTPATPGSGVACRWEKVAGTWVLTELPTLPGDIGGSCYGINSAGDIAGFSRSPSLKFNPVIWAAPALAPAVPAGLTGLDAALSAINDVGQTLGDLRTPGEPRRAFLHDGNALTELGTLGDPLQPQSYALRINNSGTAVGQCYALGADPTGFPNVDKTAFVWRSGTMSALDDLIPSGSGWEVKQCQDINESGQIAVFGLHDGLWRGALLSEVCYADCDGNSALNIDDFLCFQLKFALADPYADCDGNSLFNIDDFLCFQLAFALGCP